MTEKKQLRDVLDFDRRFNGITLRSFDKVLEFRHISAEEMKEICVEQGDVKLLSVGQFEGYTTKELAGDNLCQGEVITIPTGGAANFKYHNGYFVDSGNILCSPKDESVVGKYVFYFLCYSVDVVNSYYQGASIKHPKMADICKMVIPIGTPSEQKKIVEEFELLTKTISQQKRLLDELNQFQKAIFYRMFGSPSLNDKGWRLLHIDDIVLKKKNSIKRGPFGGALKKEIFVPQGYLVYEQYHALNRDFSFERYYITEQKYQELIDFAVEPNDIIISCSGVNLGRLAIVPQNAKPGVINQALLKVSLDNKIMTNEMFDYIFTDEGFKDKYFGTFRGCAIPNFPPMSDFRKFEFIVPPIDLQLSFSERIQQIELQKSSVKDALKDTQALFDYTMNKHFG